MNCITAPTYIEYRDFKFLITNTPGHFYMNRYIQTLLQFDAKLLVRVCEKSYNDNGLFTRGIVVEELLFPDGSFPDDFTIHRWCTICKAYFTRFPTSSIAVHCESGLGRAPVLVAIALIELGMKPDNAICLIRHKRRGAFNNLQHTSLKTYTAHSNCIDKNAKKKMKKCTIL